MSDEQDFFGPVSLPGQPTQAPPGSEEKIRVMTERALRREQLFHPQDGRRYVPRRTRVQLAWRRAVPTNGQLPA